MAYDYVEFMYKDFIEHLDNFHIIIEGDNLINHTQFYKILSKERRLYPETTFPKKSSILYKF